MRNTLLLVLLYALNTQPLLADQIDPEQKAEDDPQVEVEDQPDIGEIPQLAGPNGVTEELNRNAEERDAFDGPDLFEPWFNWKEEQLEKHGLSLGFKAWFLIQTASESMSYSDDAAGSIYRLQGSSNGGTGVPAEKAASAGVEYSPRVGRALTAGLGWARPSEDTYGPGLGDEYVTELSYRLQLTKNFSLLPDVQIVFNPALNPAEDRFWVLGLRASLAL
jgi:hypothetical protein